MDIRSLVEASPELQALRDAGDYGAIAAAINAMGLTKVGSVNGGIGTIMEAIGPETGGALLDQLQMIGKTNSAVKWALVLIERGDLNFGSAPTRAMIDQLCPPAAAAALKAVAESPDTTDHSAVSAALGA